MQDRLLVEWFMKGLNTPLLNRILNLENPPTTIQGWYTTASKMNTTRDPYAMDVDRLSIQEQADHMKKGLCFVCYLPGHRANDHGSGGSRSPPAPRRQYTPLQTPPMPTSYPAALKKADGVYAHIKTIYGNLSEEGKRKLTDFLEESGF